MYEFTKNYMDAGTLAITMGYSSAATTVADAEANGIPLHDGAAYGLVVGRGVWVSSGDEIPRDLIPSLQLCTVP